MSIVRNHIGYMSDLAPKMEHCAFYSSQFNQINLCCHAVLRVTAPSQTNKRNDINKYIYKTVPSNVWLMNHIQRYEYAN